MEETIESSYAAAMPDSFYGVKRLGLANEGAIRCNIELLLKKLEKA